MTTVTKLSVPLPTELSERLVQLATLTKQSKTDLATEAIAAFVERELKTAEGIQEGLADMRSGKVVSHSEAMRRVKRSIEKASRNRT